VEIKKIKSLIRKQEGSKLDFKLKLFLNLESNKKELAKDISAIANSKGGRGYIIVGIDDKTKSIVGLKENEIIKEEQVQQIISSRCEPPIPITVENYIIEEKRIYVITIYSSEQKPYQIRETGAFHIRRGSITDTMRRQELVETFEENLNFFTETSLIVRSDISNLNKDLVKKYFLRKNIVLDEANEEFLLESSGIAYKEKEEGRICCTLGGLLVFSDDNSMFLPNNMIKIVNKVNKDIDEVTIIQGNILEMIDKSEKLVEEIVLEDYPKEAIIEAIKNAVLYRKYSSIDRVIEVIIGYKSILIISPGSLIEKNTSNKFENNNKRNMWLYEKLITLDNNKRFLNNGQGFTRIKRAFSGKAYVKFVNSTEEDSFKIILPGITNYNK
jgi:predicted HTH transcriptional regulator